MRLKTLGTLVLGVSVANAFQDTSPLFFFSSAKLPSDPSNLIPQLQSASSLTQDIQRKLYECPSDAYIIVSQPGVTAADYTLRDAAPRLRKSVLGEEADIQTSFAVSEVHGEVNVEELERMLEHRCKAEVMSIDASTGSFGIVQDMQPRVLRVEFPRLPKEGSARTQRLSDHDSFLSSIIDLLPSSKYTVIYTTSPLGLKDKPSKGEVPAVDLENFESHEHWQYDIHTDLKRDVNAIRQTQNGTTDSQPLFAKYAFLSPGIFMALLVCLPLLGILFVALNAVSSLQVSYGAFAKEMGPQAQKKQ